ncbi:MAG: GDSL-type esterase/lipase family protein [Hyphomonadaceae bacterium]|nr:GDSL-type esterase/lipase family protein [Hyphomonadaceae bacterium]
MLARWILAGLALGLSLGNLAHADTRNVRILGRAAVIAGGGVKLQWAASGFEARVVGKSLTATIVDEWGDNWLNIEVDGKRSAIQLKAGTADYVIFSGKPGVHTVRVTRRTNSQGGATQLLDVRSDGSITPTAVPKRRMLVIGDSITSGYGVEGADQHCRYSKETQNADAAYPSLVARSFAADLELVSMDGWGLYRNYMGSPPTMKQMAWQTLPTDATPWPIGKSFPQVIIIALGANDFASGDPGDGFTADYQSLIEKLRVAHKNAHIFGVFGGILDGERYAAGRTAISTTIAKLKKAGDSRVHFIEFTLPNAPRRWGCDWHPGLDAQQRMARTLQTEIDQYVAW